jgi:hypothetical protein
LDLHQGELDDGCGGWGFSIAIDPWERVRSCGGREANDAGAEAAVFTIAKREKGFSTRDAGSFVPPGAGEAILKALLSSLKGFEIFALEWDK